MNTSNSIKNWSEDERPREKMLQKGGAALTDAELLAILISSGTKEKSALDLARDILALAHNNLQQLGKLNIHDLQKTKGIGEARAITIAAALELGRRRQVSEGVQRSVIITTKDATNILLPLLQDMNHETFCILYLSQSNRLLRHELLGSGGLTNAVADIRIILKNALLYNANRFILAHNHPSGNSEPSEADKKLTTQLKEAAELMDMKLLDHIIVSTEGAFSMSNAGMM